MKNFLKILLISLLVVPSFAFATVAVGWNATSTDKGGIQPNAVNGNIPFIIVPGFLSTASSTVPANFFQITGLNNGCVQISSSLLTSTGLACGTGGSSFAFPFTVQTGYNSTTTVIGFNGLFSTASSTFSDNLFLTSGFANGLLYTGTNGLVQTTATTSVTAGSGISFTPFTALGSSPITIACTGCSGSSVPNLSYLTLSGTAYYTASSTLTDNKSFYFGNGGIFNASTTVSAAFRLPSLSQGTLYLGSTGLVNTSATSSIASGVGITVTNGSTAYVLGAQPSIACNTASGSTFGCLSTADWSRFNTATTTFSTGLTYTLATNAVTVNTTQNITTLSNLSTAGTVNTTSSGVLYSTGTSTPGTTSPIGYTGTLGQFIGGVSGNFTCTTCLTTGAVVTVAQGGTNSTSFSPNSIITSDSAGTTLIATGTQLTVGNLIASTSATSQFWGNLVTGTTTVTTAGNIVEFYKDNAGATRLAINNPNAAGITNIRYYRGSTITANTTYDSTLSPKEFQAVAAEPGSVLRFYTTPVGVVNALSRMSILDSGFIGLGTSTPLLNAQTTSASSTAPQLALSAGAGVPQITMRNAGGNLYISTTTVQGNATTTTAALSIMSTGMLGLGTTTPTGNNVNGSGIDIYGTLPIITLTDSANKCLMEMLSTANIGIVGTGSNCPMAFVAGGNVLAGMDVLGNFYALGQGFFATSTGQSSLVSYSTTKPQLELSSGAGQMMWTFRSIGNNLYISTTTVQGNATSTLNAMRIDPNGAVYFPESAIQAGAATDYWCYDANAQLVRVSALCTTSARRFKKDIQPLDLTLDDLKLMRPVSYYRKVPFDAMDSHQQSGFIADEVASSSPKLNELLVTYVGGGTSGEVQGFRYDQYTSALTLWMQELNAKVESLPQYAEQIKKNMQDFWQWWAIGALAFWNLLITGYLIYKRK